jgi:hypothetical protein
VSSLEGRELSLSEIVEASFTTCGVVKEVLVPVTCQNETESLVVDEAFDRAVHGCPNAAGDAADAVALLRYFLITIALERSGRASDVPLKTCSHPGRWSALFSPRTTKRQEASMKGSFGEQDLFPAGN